MAAHVPMVVASTHCRNILKSVKCLNTSAWTIATKGATTNAKPHDHRTSGNKALSPAKSLAREPNTRASGTSRLRVPTKVVTSTQASQSFEFEYFLENKLGIQAERPSQSPEGRGL